MPASPQNGQTEMKHLKNERSATVYPRWLNEDAYPSVPTGLRLIKTRDKFLISSSLGNDECFSTVSTCRARKSLNLGGYNKRRDRYRLANTHDPRTASYLRV